MSDYDFTRLGPREFEHLIQALAKKHIAAGVMPFGDGPDGGREATFHGRMDYPSQAHPWNGYLVIQCKFRTRPTNDPAKDARWAITQLTGDLKKFADIERALPRPDYYLFVTNIALTATTRTGSKDRALAVLAEHGGRIGLSGYDIWSYDEICRFLDDSPAIRSAYDGFVTSGDVLSTLKEHLDLRQSQIDAAIGATHCHSSDSSMLHELLLDDPLAERIPITEARHPSVAGSRIASNTRIRITGKQGSGKSVALSQLLSRLPATEIILLTSLDCPDLWPHIHKRLTATDRTFALVIDNLHDHVMAGQPPPLLHSLFELAQKCDPRVSIYVAYRSTRRQHVESILTPGQWRRWGFSELCLLMFAWPMKRRGRFEPHK